MRQVQAAYMASAGSGSGVLRHCRQSYPFSVRGVGVGGVGGVGTSTIEAVAACCASPQNQHA